MYLALYRKWRPKSFEDVISQPHITTTLKSEVKDNHVAHAYLFTGPRGTGKTTCSKILAMAVNCENPQDGNPCMQCDSCHGIEQGSILDVVEIDAASNNGVDNIRSLRDEASYTPSQCKYRVYIIDEAHMLSTGAFNALLKIMEEPPEHVIFILATTEAHKVPATILSRCQRFDFRRIKLEDSAKLLMSVSHAEKDFTLTEDAAVMIARLSDGGMRDAYSLLDQCIAYSTNVTVEVVANAAGVVGKDYLYEITDCIKNHNPSESIALLDRLYEQSKDMQGLLEELIYHFRNIMLAKVTKMSADVQDSEKLSAYASDSGFSMAVLLSVINELQECLDKMGRSMDKRLCLELCMVKLCSPSMARDDSAVLVRLQALEATVEKLINSPAPTTMAVTSGSKRAVKPEVVDNLPISDTASELVHEADAPAIPESKAEPAAAEISSDAGVSPLMEWADILKDVQTKDQPLWGVLHGSKAYVGGDFLYLESPLEFAAGMLKQEGNAQKLIAAVFAKTGMRYKLRISSKTSPSAQAAEKKASSLEDIMSKAKDMGIEVHEE